MLLILKSTSAHRGAHAALFYHVDMFGNATVSNASSIPFYGSGLSEGVFFPAASGLLNRLDCFVLVRR